MTTEAVRPPPEVSWFAALCDDDYRQLGVVDPALRSSFPHCRDIVLCAERNGYDNVLLPSGYELGIDAVAFAAGIAGLTERIRLLVAVRMGEMWVPQLARQLASLDEMLGGRLTVNVISSDLPGAALESAARYERTREWMEALRLLMAGQPVAYHGMHLDLELAPPRIAASRRRCPLLYFGGFSEPAKAVATAQADVFLTWPDTVTAVAAIVDEMSSRAATTGRTLRYGLRTHVIVRETEAEARAAAEHLVAALDPKEGERIRARSLDAASVGVRRQAELRDAADADGFAEEGLWTGIGRARSGAGAAIVGDPRQVRAKLDAYRSAGIDAFILSGYPHATECERFARLVLDDLNHAPLGGP